MSRTARVPICHDISLKDGMEVEIVEYMRIEGVAWTRLAIAEDPGVHSRYVNNVNGQLLISFDVSYFFHSSVILSSSVGVVHVCENPDSASSSLTRR